MSRTKKDKCINMLNNIQSSIEDYDICVGIDCLMSILMSIDELCWIPISKSVPKEQGEYLTTTIHGSVFCDCWNGECFERTETVIAWMEKPEPYVWRNEDE